MKINSIKIINVEIIEEEIEVVNFTCEPYPYYFSNNILSHNCDSMYAVKKTNEPIEKLPVEEVVNRIIACNCNDVTFTGGEPMLYIEQIKGVMKLLSLSAEYSFHFETNGKICPEGLEEYNTTITVSPKFHAINLVNEDRENVGEYIGQLRKWDKLEKRPICFKFVYESPNTIEQIKKLDFLMYTINNPIYLMPEGKTFDLAKYKECAEQCVKNNYRMSPRLHVILYGNKRGT